MATQKQLRSAIAAARERGWYTTSGTTLGAPSNAVELDTPENIPDRWWSGKTYTRHRAVSFLVAENHKGEPRISAVFAREHAAPWVDARDRRVSFREAIAILESE